MARPAAAGPPAWSLRASGGSFRIGGLDPRSDDGPIRQRIGVISHQSYLYDDLTARQNLEFFARIYGVPDPARRTSELLEDVGLAHRADDPLRTFSRGMQQRVSLARSLVHDPGIIFLDEPFTGLDEASSRALSQRLRTLRDDRRIVLLATHDLDVVDGLIDRAVVLSSGRMMSLAGTGGSLRERYRHALGLGT